MKRVDLSWPPDKIREFCESEDDWVLMLPHEWSADQVQELYRRQLTIPNPYIGVISEIADDPRTPIAILEDIWKRFGSAIEVASSLALNPNTPAALHRQLAAHDDEVVREHAKQRLGGD